MKNRLLFFLSILLNFGSLQDVSGQLLDNRLDIFVGYQYGLIHGNEYIQKGQFKFPSFYNNLSSLHGYTIQGIYKIHDQFSTGLSFEHFKSSDWSSANEIVFEGGQADLSIYSLLLCYHTRFKKEDVFNRVKLYAEISPGFGASSISLENSPFNVFSGVERQEAPVTATSNIFRVKVGIGAEYSFSQNIGIDLEYGISNNWTQSPLNTDDEFLMSNITFCLFYKFFKNKRFFY